MQADQASADCEALREAEEARACGSGPQNCPLPLCARNGVASEPTGIFAHDRA